MHLKVSSAKWRPSCLGLNVLNGAPLSVLGIRLIHVCKRVPSIRIIRYQYTVHAVIHIVYADDNFTDTEVFSILHKILLPPYVITASGLEIYLEEFNGPQ